MDLITISELQNALSISRSTVLRLNQKGRIRFVRFGRAVRIPREDVEALLSSKVD